jgi:hypothetical protein
MSGSLILWCCFFLRSLVSVSNLIYLSVDLSLSSCILSLVTVGSIVLGVVYVDNSLPQYAQVIVMFRLLEFQHVILLMCELRRHC